METKTTTSEGIKASSESTSPSEASLAEKNVSASLEKSEAWATLFEEMFTYLVSYLRTKIDTIKLTTREIFFNILLGILSLFLVGGALFVAIAFMMYGIATRLGKVLGGELWLGYFLTGAFFLLSVGLSLKLIFVLIRRKSLKEKVKDYEKKLEAQRIHFGQNAVDRAIASTK